ncbi:unnamed protein product, partial [Amoebophrya sp. A25]
DNLGRWIVHELLDEVFDKDNGHYDWDLRDENDDRILAIIPDPHFICFHAIPRQLVQRGYWYEEEKVLAHGT